jgi:16S rRNA C967 or C1407 C5-methylase (RsmB/RsmF family)
MKKQPAIEKFHQFYHDIYGSRWPKLFEAMQIKEKQVARHCFRENDKILKNEISWLAGCEWYSSQSHNPQNLKQDGLREIYVMDPASVIVARSLKLENTEHILDMCAAPGGKTLILAENMGKGSELWCNEPSAPRRERLTKVIQDYVPLTNRQQIFVKGKDGPQYGLQFPDKFDKILIDAPCSGERHMIMSPNELKGWSIKRTKRLAAIQYSMLCAGLLALKNGGELVYSTCALSPIENDGVIEKLLEKKSDQFELIVQELPNEFAEKTKYGIMHLPDKAQFGPLYYTKLRKRMS